MIYFPRATGFCLRSTKLIFNLEGMNNITPSPRQCTPLSFSLINTSERVFGLDFVIPVTSITLSGSEAFIGFSLTTGDIKVEIKVVLRLTIKLNWF